MSDSVPLPAPVPAKAPAKTSWVRILILAVMLVAIAGGVYAVIYYSNQDTGTVDSGKLLKEYLAQQSKNAKLADGYTDADKDLIADPPANGPLQNPNEIVFCVVGADDPVKAEAMWKPLMEAIAAKTGKKVVYLQDPPPPPREDGEPAPLVGVAYETQLEELRNGKLFVTAFSTGQVTGAVNTAGFVPLFCPADAQGNFTYEMEVIVPADSPLKSPADLKGQRVAFSSLSSNSGGKAPLVTFKKDFGLLPGRDYEFTLTGDHKRTIKEVCEKKHPAGCVANDILQQMTNSGEVKADQYKSIYKSAKFPPLCFGVPHNLDKTLRTKIEAAFSEFTFAGNSVGERYKSQNRTKFARVNFEADWKDVREIDAQLVKLLD